VSRTRHITQCQPSRQMCLSALRRSSQRLHPPLLDAITIAMALFKQSQGSIGPDCHCDNDSMALLSACGGGTGVGKASEENLANALALKVTVHEANPETATPKTWVMELIQ
jgi:hypothetical protein